MRMSGTIDPLIGAAQAGSYTLNGRAADATVRIRVWAANLAPIGNVAWYLWSWGGSSVGRCQT